MILALQLTTKDSILVPLGAVHKLMSLITKMIVLWCTSNVRKDLYMY